MSISSKIKSVGNAFSDTLTAVDRGLDRSGIDLHTWGNVKSIHNIMPKHSSNAGLKTLGKVAAGVGSSAFQTATKTGYGTMAYGAVTGTAVTVSATGVGALAVVGTYALGSSVAAGVSVYKTNKHINGLKRIMTVGDQKSGCNGDRLQHDVVFHQVLPYIIVQEGTQITPQGGRGCSRARKYGDGTGDRCAQSLNTVTGEP